MVVTAAAVRADALVQQAAEAERQIAFWQAQQLQVLAELDGVHVPGEELDKHWAREELACALRVQSGAAASRVRVAVAVVERMARVHKMLAAGELTLRHVWVLTDVEADLDDLTLATLLDRVLDDAPAQSVGEFSRAVQRAVLELAPSSDDEQQVAVAGRYLGIRHTMHGMSSLWALLPTEAVVGIAATVEALARHWAAEPGEARTLEQLRADAFTHLATGRPTTGRPTTGGRDATRTGFDVQVTVALSTLLGHDEQPGEIVSDHVPTSLGGGTIPISATLARALAFDPTGTWRRLLTDHHGRLLDYGRTTYRPPTALARFVRARDRHCTFPHCQRPAMRCDLDHRTAWQHGGTTSECNLHPLCERHHYLKHHTTWTVQHLPDGTTRWTTPTGRHHDSPPATYPTDRTNHDHLFDQLTHTDKPPDPPPPPF